MKYITFLLLLFTTSFSAISPNFFKHKDSLNYVLQTYWPSYPDKVIFAGQIESESCASKVKCWNTRSELKTYREYGFGLGQITIAYRADGTERMNVFKENKARYKELRDWNFEDRYNAKYQLLSIVLMNKTNWAKLPMFTNPKERQAAMLAAYNGGLGSVLKDRSLCMKTVKDGTNVCNTWYNGVEKYSYKSRIDLPGYGGRSPFDINREYPYKVERAKIKYIPYILK